MISLLDSIGPAIWRASWQASALAIVVILLLRCLGDRLAPRWRFLFWGVVLMRLLLVATPGSPWSAFNLARWSPPSDAMPMPPRDDVRLTAESPRMESTIATGEPRVDAPREGGTAPASPSIPAVLPAETPTAATGDVAEDAPSVDGPSLAASIPTSIARALPAVWLAGCVILGLRLMATAIVLRRRLSICRPVTDPALLGLLEASRVKLGLGRVPTLLVTPGCLSPCLVGTWNPRIVLPESIVTQESTARLRHVLSHELAHLVRRDAWTNWLMLMARILHWFNPVAWWTVRAMQAEREAACDELAFAALAEADRPAYAATLIELAASLPPSSLAPGLIGLFTSTGRLRARVERLLRSPSVKTVRAPLATGLLVVTALAGLTDAMPGAATQVPKPAAPPQEGKPEGKTYTMTGRCVDDSDQRPLAGVSVRLYRVEGKTSPPAEAARTVTDADGRYTFNGLVPPRPEGYFDRLVYAVFGFADDRPIGISFSHYAGDREVFELRMPRATATLSGKVVDAEGRPVAGASVLPYIALDRPIPGLLDARTDAEGRFKIDRLGVIKWPDGRAVATSFEVLHPDHPATRGTARALPAEVVVTMPGGCVVTGSVTDGTTGQPGSGAVITARRVDEWGEVFAAADAAGRFRLVVPEGRYDFLAEARDRVCVALTDRECLAGESVTLPPFTLIGGGIIAGQVVNTATGQPVTVSESGGPIMLGLFGPSQPAGRVIAPARLAEVDGSGRFRLRAAPGENFPYFVNTRGDRMAWDTRQQPPVVVKDGETTAYNMLITPKVSPEERLKAARALVATLSKTPGDRTAQILFEFRKLGHTVDETERWCLLMRELVAVGRDAVPQLCDELDRTTEDRTLRRLAFALRAIGDPRAVPALIRALPRTLLPSSSDYGLVVGDRELTAFMQAHDLRPGAGGTYFDLGRPVREIVGTLHALTGADLEDADLFQMSLSEDPRRQVLQRRIYGRQARRWQAWWEKNGPTVTNDPASRNVGLALADEPLPDAPGALGKSARLGDGMMGAVLSPAIDQGPHAWLCLDLDTGYRPRWPAQIPRDEAARDPKRLADWAAQSGVDLVCSTYRSPDGTETYVLRALGMDVREISARDLRNLDRLIASGTLPQGRAVTDGLLMHHDAEAQRLVPDANAAFLYVTREGNMGLIETTDRVTRTANLTGLAGGAPSGVGFHKGVRFNLKAIIP
jgi:beta-lactamase regulating signal transducer with metallopeptidase domain